MRKHRNWLDRAEMLTPPLPWDRPRWRDRGGPVVVLLHGLWRGWHAMEPLARALDQHGFSTLNIPYPSTRMPVPVLVRRIQAEILRIAGDQPIHLVTHSLGGIIARSLIAEAPAWRPGRLVMLAPPNGGSEIVDWSRRHPLIHWLLGPAGRSLGCDGLPSRLPPLPAEIEAAVIMGSRSSIPLFKKLLDEAKYKSSTPAAAMVKWLGANANLTGAVIRINTFQQFHENFGAATKLAMAPQDREALALLSGYNKGLTCLLCSQCVSQCPEHIGIADIFRYERYAMDYHELGRAREEYAALTRNGTSCVACGDCLPSCVQEINIPQKLKDVQRLLG